MVAKRRLRYYSSAPVLRLLIEVSSDLIDNFRTSAMLELSFLTFKPMSHRGVLTLPFVKVKGKFQITLPTELREKLRLGVGDILEATLNGQTIVLTPKAIVDREQAWTKIERAMASVEDLAPKPNQSPQEEEEAIARMVKDYRKHHAAGRD